MGFQFQQEKLCYNNENKNGGIEISFLSIGDFGKYLTLILLTACNYATVNPI